MAAGFRIRRVRSEQSIGDRLKRARTRKKISIAEVEEATKVREKFLLCLESDSWDEIPSAVYGRGYLERYVAFLGLPKEEIMSQYERERTAFARRCKDGNFQIKPSSRVMLPTVVFTPRLVASGGVMLFCLALLGTVGWQVRQFTAPPFLYLSQPTQATPTGEVKVQGDTYNVSGRTAQGSRVEINGMPAQVDASGSFTASIPLREGLNPIKVTATNRHNDMAEEQFLVTSVN